VKGLGLGVLLFPVRFCTVFSADGLGFRVYVLGFRVSVLGFRVYVLGFRV
jgi:hypothetical protein